MAPMWSADRMKEALAPHAAQLIALARRSIAHGLTAGGPLPVAPSGFDPVLCRQAATFVTLQCGDDLRGCVGTLEARAALVEDVARNAYLAAFADTRFDPVEADELGGLAIEISVLGPPEPIAFDSEAALLRRLRPGQDGLILEQDGRRGVFLPQVWEDLPDPAAFVLHLKEKAGIGSGPLDRTTQASRFSVVKLRALTGAS